MNRQAPGFMLSYMMHLCKVNLRGILVLSFIREGCLELDVVFVEVWLLLSPSKWSSEQRKKQATTAFLEYVEKEFSLLSCFCCFPEI